MPRKKEDKINVANAITLFRIFPGLLCLVYIFFENRLISIMLYLLFLVMDLMDGRAARLFKCETKFGRNFDFFVDGLVGTLVMLMLFYKGLVPTAYMVLIAIPLAVKGVFIWKGIKMSRGTFVRESWGKINGAVLFMIPLLFMTEDVIIGLSLAYIALIYVYVSSIKYVYEIKKLEKEAKSRRGLKKK